MIARQTMYILSRLFMLLCSFLLLFNTSEVIRFRNSTLSLQQLVEQRLRDDPINYSPQLAASDIARVKFSKWLGLHVWPVPLWLLLAFVQTTAGIRRKYLALHRWSGRVFLLLSMYMTFGYAMMFITGEPLLGEPHFYIDFRQPRKFFTFRAATAIFTAWWIVSAFKTYSYAKRKLIKLHKYWAWQFLATGFAVGTMRIFMVLVLFPWFLKGGQHVYEKETQDVLTGYSSWLAFLLSALSAHVVFGRETAPSADMKIK